MPKGPSPSLPLPQPQDEGPKKSAVPQSQRSVLRSYRPDYVKPPQLPHGDQADKFTEEWFAPEPSVPILTPAVQTMPMRWEMAFPTQLQDWRERSLRLRGPQHQHAMIPGQTWLLYVPIPEGEAVHLDSKDGAEIQAAKQRLLLVCLPPQVMISEGDLLAVSDPRDLERPVNASKMPQEVITVCRNPRLLLEHELDSLAWAASEDREALVGEKLP